MGTTICAAAAQAHLFYKVSADPARFTAASVNRKPLLKVSCLIPAVAVIAEVAIEHTRRLQLRTVDIAVPRHPPERLPVEITALTGDVTVR